MTEVDYRERAAKKADTMLQMAVEGFRIALDEEIKRIDYNQETEDYISIIVSAAERLYCASDIIIDLQSDAEEEKRRYHAALEAAEKEEEAEERDDF